MGGLLHKPTYMYYYQLSRENVVYLMEKLIISDLPLQKNVYIMDSAD